MHAYMVQRHVGNYAHKWSRVNFGSITPKQYSGNMEKEVQRFNSQQQK